MVFLIITVVADVASVVLLGQAHGFERPALLAGGMAAVIVGLVTFSYATKTIPAGLANAVWAGASLVLVVLVGRIFLSETLTAAQYACLALIVVGTVGISLSTPAAA